jgi:hypothetical protein
MHAIHFCTDYWYRIYLQGLPLLLTKSVLPVILSKEVIKTEHIQCWYDTLAKEMSSPFLKAVQ